MDCRLQLQGELQAKADAAKKYRGVFHGVKVILQNEGPRGLFRGLGCAVCIHYDHDAWMWTDRIVHLPSPFERMPSRILRTAARRRNKGRIPRSQRSVPRNQRLRRRIVRYYRCRSRLSFLPRQDSTSILFYPSPRRHAAPVPQRV